MKKIILGEKFKGKYDFRETCFGIYQKEGKLLLVKKNNQYSLVGGGIDKNETQEECLKREFLEETGYPISSIKELVSIDCFWLADNKYPLESLANIYIVDIDETCKIDALEKDTHEIEFVDIDSVESLLPLPYHKEAIKEYLKNKRNN